LEVVSDRVQRYVGFRLGKTERGGAVHGELLFRGLGFQDLGAVWAEGARDVRMY